MTKEEVIQQIQNSIITNGNEEITAEVLRPVLENMVNQSNDAVGDLDELATDDKTSTVAAINEVKQTTFESKNIVPFGEILTFKNDKNIGKTIEIGEYGMKIFNSVLKLGIFQGGDSNDENNWNIIQSFISES